MCDEAMWVGPSFGFLASWSVGHSLTSQPLSCTANVLAPTPTDIPHQQPIDSDSLLQSLGRGGQMDDMWKLEDEAWMEQHAGWRLIMKYLQ